MWQVSWRKGQWPLLGKLGKETCHTSDSCGQSQWEGAQGGKFLWEKLDMVSDQKERADTFNT
jgi:hypothetical protein